MTLAGPPLVHTSQPYISHLYSCLWLSFNPVLMAIFLLNRATCQGSLLVNHSNEKSLDRKAHIHNILCAFGCGIQNFSALSWPTAHGAYPYQPAFGLSSLWQDQKPIVNKELKAKIFTKKL